MRISATIVLLLYSSFFVSANASELIQFGKLEQQVFSPARGDTKKIPVVLNKEAGVTLAVYSVDGELVRTINTSAPLGIGKHDIEWDGKDNEGILVPDEAWILTLTAAAGTQTQVVDPRTYSGGETIKNIQISPNDHHSYRYQLPAAARVSIRAGVSGGPLLNVLSDWEPHTAGSNLLYWDGFDKNKVIDLKQNNRKKLAATAFKLPEHSIITTGNGEMDFQQYADRKNWEQKPVVMAGIQLERNNQPVSRQYYLPYRMNKSPDISVELLGNIQLSSDGVPQITDFVDIKVSMSEVDRKALQGSRYEIGFFVDNSFVSEEEQGYVPLTWRWKPNNLSPGKHVLTVNVSSFRGQVGVSSLEFEIPEN